MSLIQGQESQGAQDCVRAVRRASTRKSGLERGTGAQEGESPATYRMRGRVWMGCQGLHAAG